MTQKIIAGFLVFLIATIIFWLFASAIHKETTRVYEPPPREAAPNAYKQAKKEHWKKVICSKCHEDTTEWAEKI